MMSSPHLFHVPSHPEYGVYPSFSPQTLSNSSQMPPYFLPGHHMVDHFPGYFPGAGHPGNPAILRYPVMNSYRPVIRMGMKEGPQMPIKVPFFNPYAPIFPTRFTYTPQETICLSPDSPNPVRPMYIQSPYPIDPGPSHSPSFRDARKDSSPSPHPIIILPPETARKRSYQDMSPHDMSSGESVISPGFEPSPYLMESEYSVRSKKGSFGQPGQFMVPALILPPKSPSVVSVNESKDPAYFNKGSIIQLGTGDLRRVEDLTTDDLIQSAEMSTEVKLDHSKIVKIEEYPSRGVVLLTFAISEQKLQVTVEAGVEHPFFVFRRGWSSINPDKTFHKYKLSCHKLRVGDVCISLTHKEQSKKAEPKPESSEGHTFLVPTLAPSGRRSESNTPVNYSKGAEKEKAAHRDKGSSP